MKREDLRERIQRAIAELEILHAKARGEANGEMAMARLAGKIEGLRLVLDYLRATDADLAALGYVKLDVDVEALRGVVEAPPDPWKDDLTDQEIDVLWKVARQVLAALDGETT